MNINLIRRSVSYSHPIPYSINLIGHQGLLFTPDSLPHALSDILSDILLTTHTDFGTLPTDLEFPLLAWVVVNGIIIERILLNFMTITKQDFYRLFNEDRWENMYMCIGKIDSRLMNFLRENLGDDGKAF